ncbi:MAG: hypothetical protein JSR59_21525 [Proteobacteria bacterium]|nr:hypothetical protein [Pseudomonadota bacterium]
MQSKQREAGRRAQAIGAKLSNAARAMDTRKKILVGSWALKKAERVEDFNAAMLRELDKVWLWRDDDRALFGLEALSEEEKAQRQSFVESRLRMPLGTAAGDTSAAKQSLAAASSVEAA